MPTDEVLAKLNEKNIKRTVATSTLAELSDVGRIHRIGEGKKGRPYRYYKPAPKEEIHSFATPSLRADERKEEPNAEKGE